MNQLLALAMTSPILAAVPDPSPIQPPGTGGVNTILGWLMWIGLAVAVGALIAVGILVAVSLRRGEGGHVAGTVMMPLLGAIIIGAAAAIIGFLA